MLVMGMSLAATARASIPVTQVGFTNGDDWEPAISVDGQYVYVTWAHFGTPQQDSSGATCKTKGVTSYTYFQRSTNGGATWDPYILPRCPVSGTQIDLQVVVGPNHRVYVSYMDGPQANSNVELVYSDDHGVTWSSPVNVVVHVLQVPVVSRRDENRNAGSPKRRHPDARRAGSPAIGGIE